MVVENSIKMKHSHSSEKSASANVNLPELKRVQSVKQMIKTYRQQQNAIKEALGNLDKKPSKKIIFDEDNDYDEEDVKKVSEGNKKSLFQSDEEDEEEESYDFEMKDHFMGKEGQQLLQLQSKFKGDARFKMDKRFIESDEQHNQDNNAATTELSLEEEKKNEIDILQEVLGTKIKSNKPQEISTEKHMLRYDPTQSHHVQYEIKPPDDKKKTKKKKDKHTTQQENEESEINQPNVSKDVFYQVKDDLKNTFQSQQSFSLLSSFGKNVDREDGDQMEEEPTEIKNRDKLYLENNPFQYDSSEDEVENVQENNGFINGSQPEVKFISEPFFFKDDDFRLQEGSDFVKRIASESNSEFGEQRRNLKHIVKAKVRNNTRKNNPFKKKLGGNKKKKMFRIRKALKR